jgi:hypothetical protein
MLVPVAVSTMLGLGFLYFPVRSTFLMTTLKAGFVISIMWTQMLAAYRLLRQKISNIVSHFNLLCVLPVVWSLSDDADYSWYPLQRHH